MSMQQFDSEEIIVYRSNPKNRFNWLYIIPALGVLWVLFLSGAVAFQWEISTLVNPVMGIMMLIFLASVILLFWAMAPRENR